MHRVLFRRQFVGIVYIDHVLTILLENDHIPRRGLILYVITQRHDS